MIPGFSGNKPTANSVRMRQNLPQLQSVFSKFLATLVSSWVVGPAGVFFLHFWGWGSNPILIALLLAFSAAAPIQLLLNEFVAPGAVAGKFYPSRLQIVLIISCTALAIWIALGSSRVIVGGGPLAPPYLGLAVFTSLSVWLSYRTSLRYYDAVSEGGASHLVAVYVGLIPGLVTLFIFGLAVVANNPIFLLGASVLPAAAQLLFTKVCAPASTKECGIAQKRILSHLPLLIMGFILVGVGIGSALLRDMLSGYKQEYAALILVSLNVFGTLANSLSRAAYLSSGQSFGKPAGFTTVILLLSAAFIYAYSNIAGALLALLGLQFLVVTVLAMGRMGANVTHPL